MKAVEILKLKAGRKTDLLVAKHVFSCTEGQGGKDKTLALPSYSSDINDTYKIINRFTELGYSLRITETRQLCCVEIIAPNQTISITDKTIELTVCKASLYFLYQGGYNELTLH